MNENEQTLQIMVEYYRNKYYQLEHDFLIYKITAENIIQQITKQLQESNQSDTEEPNEPAGSDEKK